MFSGLLIKNSDPNIITLRTRSGVASAKAPRDLPLHSLDCPTTNSGLVASFMAFWRPAVRRMRGEVDNQWKAGSVLLPPAMRQLEICFLGVV